MSIENEVFRKIKEISARESRPRPEVTTFQLANELEISSDNLLPSLTQLEELKLLNFCDADASIVRLTLLGTVVKRDK